MAAVPVQLASWPLVAGIVVAVLGLGSSALLVRQQTESAENVAQARFTQAANALAEALTRRLDTYTEIGFGLRSLFVVDPALGRKGFDDAVGRLGLESRVPEVLNVAFTRYLTGADKAEFEQRVRGDRSMDPRGYPAFAVRPPGERAEYFVADYLWPMAENIQVHGLDISAQPMNMASMRHSMQSGEAVVSAPFDLLQFSTRPTGIVIRLPVFRNAGSRPPGAGRAADFLGSVAVTLRVVDLFQRLEREGRMQGLRVSVTDQGSFIAKQSDAQARVLFSNMPAGVQTAVPFQRNLAVYTRSWRLDFAPDAPFLSDSERRAPWMMGAASGVIALLLAALVTLLMRERQAALSRAAASRAALEDSEGRWKFAIEGSGDGLWDWDLATGRTYFSARWKALLGYADGEIGAHYDEWSRRVHPQDLAQATQALEACRAGVLPLFVSEYRMACKDGSWKWVLDRGQVVRRDASGVPVRMIGTMSDISGRKRSDEVLQASLRDKEALLKEVHHRVKNNLQVITSLLRLESRRSVLAETRATLSDMQGRIGSMALLHESLYRSGAFASVDLADYLHKVVKAAHDAQMAPGSPVQVRSQLGRLVLGMDQALPCGLMVNELISNALKHGFPAGRGGEVLVVLEPAGDGTSWRLRVGDNGVGLPAGFALDGLSSMGLQLVSQLCQQIGGTLDVQPNPGRGAVFTVVFPVEAPAPLVMPE